ncbi:cation:proton antiporter [Adlercreutzia agrestimuris]|uniref:cation:proton antiporter domain-containing protein n=1 Tax=Adlercreutzia agrestimuris TaxID=2941324 RepID=UPI0020412852|nr:cation:proton antiporter [Adlercreutzia agrestimuris]
MTHLPQLISDLALLLAVAAAATIVCKKLKLPLVIGYVAAGFIVGPAFVYFPDLGDPATISTWSDIGVIFLMFGLGLEFSVIKLTTVGKSAVVTAATEMPLMIICGTCLGLVFGWSLTTSIFLGGMLAISSSSIIVKTFTDLGVKKAGFAELVFGVLVIEDIAAVFLLAILSTVAAGSSDGADAVLQIGQMALYLVVWFALAVLVVPSVLKRITEWLTDEIMLVASIAFCLLMVMLATAIGFSSALGAFLGGSILAGTVQAHRIDELFRPIKDLFGAVFFVSVGTLVAPEAIVENAPAVIAIALLTIFGRSIFCTLGALFSGQSLRMAMKCGMSLGQIGEFSFIIAALGSTLGVTPSFLYPVIVTVSVVTALTTPFMVRNSDRVYHGVAHVLNMGVLARFRPRRKTQEEEEESSLWGSMLRSWALKLALIAFSSVASVEILLRMLRPLLVRFIPHPLISVLLGSVCVLVVSLFISNLFYTSRKGEFGVLWMRSKRNHVLLLAVSIFGILVSLVSVLYVTYAAVGIRTMLSPVAIITAIVAVVALGRSRTMHSMFLKLESSFFGNLSENILEERMAALGDNDHAYWVEDHLFVVEVEASRTLKRKSGTLRPVDYLFGIAHNLDLISIVRDGKRIAGEALARLTKEDLTKRIADPHDDLGIREGDVLTFLGTEDEVDGYIQSMVEEETLSDEEADNASQSFNEYLNEGEGKSYLTCFRFEILDGSWYAGKTIAAIDFKNRYGSLVVAHVHDAYIKMKPSRNTRLFAGDHIWLIGDPKNAYPIMYQAVDQESKNAEGDGAFAESIPEFVDEESIEPQRETQEDKQV